MLRKGVLIDDSPMNSFHSILKKETLRNNELKFVEYYRSLVEWWIESYNTERLKKQKEAEG